MSHDHDHLSGEPFDDLERGPDDGLHSHVRRDEHGAWAVVVHDHAGESKTWRPRDDEDLAILLRHLERNLKPLRLVRGNDA